MPPPPSSRPSMAGGVLIALGAMGGSAAGLAFGQVTVGFLVGIGLGILVSLAIWLADRR